MLALLNMGTEPVVLAKNERVAQGIFYKYLVADGDADIDKAVRGGGFGSTKS
jgi:dUTP pyrophosphatase